MILLIKIIFIYLLISLLLEASSITLDALSIQIENEFSKYNCKDNFTLRISEYKFYFEIFHIQHLFTYESKRISNTKIDYNQPIFYYLFDIKFKITNAPYNLIEIKRNNIILKHELDFFTIIINEYNQLSYDLPITHFIAQFEKDFDLMQFKFFQKIKIDKIPRLLTKYLFESMQNSFLLLFREKFPSNSELLFKLLTTNIIKHYYEVKNEDSSDFYGTNVLIRSVKYEYMTIESHYNSMFANVIIAIDYHCGFEGYGANMKVKFISFGVFGVSFLGIELDGHDFLHKAIQEIFEKEFRNIKFER